MPRARWDNPPSISLHEIYDEFPFGMPPVIHTADTTIESVDEKIEERMTELLMQHVRSTIASICEATDKPQTVLHALMLEDNQTVGRIATHLNQPPDTFKNDLGILIETGWVQVDGSPKLPTFSLA